MRVKMEDDLLPEEDFDLDDDIDELGLDDEF